MRSVLPVELLEYINLLYLILGVVFRILERVGSSSHVYLSLIAKHIIKIDGKSGLFKGLTPRLFAGTIGTIVHSKVLQV